MKYRVATYYDPEGGKKLCKRRIKAYTVWYSHTWHGCKFYEIEAKSGAEARKRAIELRLEAERRMAGK